MSYKFAVGPRTGSDPVMEISSFSNIDCMFNLDAGDQVSFEIPASAAEARYISELATDCWLFNGDVKMQRFRVISADAAWDGDGGSSLAITAVSYKRLLFGRHCRSTLVYSSDDQAQIIWETIQHVQAQTNGDLGITAGTLNGGGILRDRTFEEGENVGKVLTDLSGVVDGPTWKIDADLVLTVMMDADFATLATPVELGVAARSMSRKSGAASFGNAGFVDGDSSATVPEWFEPPSLALDPRGRWEVAAGFPSVVLQSTLAEKVEGLVSDAQSPIAQWSVEVDPARFALDLPVKTGDKVLLVWPESLFTPVGYSDKVFGQIMTVSLKLADSGEVVVTAEIIETGGVYPPAVWDRTAWDRSVWQ